MPSLRTTGDILNRLKFRLRRVLKTKPLKKIPETDAIFEHLACVHSASASNPATLRISIDTKAKVKIGPFSRRGLSRGFTAVRAADHDMKPTAILTPAGILEVEEAQLNLIFGTSRDTSDFMADALELWWQDRREVHSHITKLQIDLDNGPQISSSRTQFMKRLVQFSDLHGLSIELSYYPPYHSKYNRVERCWGVLENHWNGALLESTQVALEWAKTMTWRGVHPIVHLLDRVYETGVRVSRAAYRPIAERLIRSVSLAKWSVLIEPQQAG